MSITDELMEYVNHTSVPKSRILMEARDRFNAIADRIDATYEEAIQQALMGASADLAAKTINRIRELEAEVEQLRTANAAFTGRSIRAGDKMACLEAENVKLRKQYEAVINDYRSEVAKLRELCADMWKAIKTHKRINFAQLLQFGERIRKLRIEVD